MIEFKSLIKL